MRLRLLLVCLLSMAQWPIPGVHVGPPNGVTAAVNPRITWTAPCTLSPCALSSLSVPISGTATAGSAALSSVSVVCSGATTLNYTATGTTAWSDTKTFGVGTTICIATVTDASSRTASTQSMTISITNPDAGSPTIAAGADASTTSISFARSVTCTDDVGCTSVTWEQGGNGLPTTCPISGSGGTVSANCTFSPLQVGTNSFTVTGTDQSGHTGTDTVVITRTGDVASPTVDAGADATVSTTTLDRAVTCNDDVACITVTWDTCTVSDGCPSVADANMKSGTCTLIGAPGPTNSANCTFDLVATNETTTANTIYVRGTDATGNTTTDTVVITRTVALAITTTTLANATYNEAMTTRQLLATGGTGSGRTWTDNGTLAADSDCTGIALSSAGVVSGTPTTVNARPATCSFTARVTDDGANTDTQALTISVVASGTESRNTYYAALAADSSSITWQGISHAWSLRNQTQVNGLVIAHDDGTNANKFHYVFPNASSTDCYLGSCGDSEDAVDGVKFTPGLNACVPTVINRTIQSTTADNPPVIRFNGASATLGATYPATISGASVSTLNGTFNLFIVAVNSVAPKTFDAQVTGATAATTGGAAGSADITICGCDGPPIAQSCSGSDSLASTNQIRLPLAIPLATTETYLASLDAYYASDFALYTDFNKIWTFIPSDNATSDDTALMFLQHFSTGRTNTDGNGAEVGVSVGPAHHEIFSAKTLAPGQTTQEPFVPSGPGSAVSGLKNPKLANFHIRANVWTRYYMMVETNLLLSDTKFAPWRALTTNNGDGAATITSCTNADPVVCTVSGNTAWHLLTANQSRRVNISGHTGLNGDQTVTVISDTQFSLPRPTGYAGGTGGTISMYYLALSWWIADETRPATRILLRVPWDAQGKPWFSKFYFSFNTSASAATRQNEVHAYFSNFVMSKGVTLDVSGSCSELTDGSANSRGYCTVDATNNPTILKQPVR